MSFELILLAYLAYKNNLRAKKKDANGLLWGGLTVVAYIVGLMVGLYVVIVNFCSNAINLEQISSHDMKVRLAASNQLLAAFSENPLHQITMDLFAIGGYLLVRYFIDKKPDKQKPEVHWMDKIGNQQGE